MNATIETKKRPGNRWGVTDMLTFDGLCELLGVRTSEKWLDDWDKISDGLWNPELSEEENQKYEEEARDEAYSAYEQAVLQVAEHVFGEHELALNIKWGEHSCRDEKKRWQTRRYVKGYKVTPKATHTWQDCANAIRETINGVGYFHFASTKEFCLSGPYTFREAVLSHLHYVPRWYDVYEGGKAASRVDQAVQRR